MSFQQISLIKSKLNSSHTPSDFNRYEIIDCLEIINNSAEMAKLSAGRSKLTNSQKLKLCVYLIERKCDFNGEGIFINSDITEYSDEEYVQMDAILENTK